MGPNGGVLYSGSQGGREDRASMSRFAPRGLWCFPVLHCVCRKRHSAGFIRAALQTVASHLSRSFFSRYRQHVRLQKA